MPLCPFIKGWIGRHREYVPLVIAGPRIRAARPLGTRTTFGDLGGHTLAFGLEAATGGFTVTAGWSRTWSTTIHPRSELSLDNPFGAGDRALPPGAYDGSIDQLGIMIDAELDAPD